MNHNIKNKRLKYETFNIIKGLFVALTFFVLFLVIFISKRKIYPSHIIFYEGVLIIFVMNVFVILAILFMRLLTYRLNCFVSYIILGVFLGSNISYAFHITFPSLIDRSISIFTLSLLHSNNLNMSEIQCNFMEHFVTKNKAIEKRVKEQVTSGNIIISNTGMQITDRGKALTSAWIRLADIFSVSKDFVEVRPSPTCEGEY
jgi:hypothetical protein